MSESIVRLVNGKRIFALLLSVQLAALFTFAGSSPEERRTISVRRTLEGIQLDGQLTEAAWKQTPAATDFVQALPQEGLPMSEPTEVRVLFDADSLYFGVYCYDSHPEQILTTGLTRDFESRESDAFGVVVDAFNDARTSFSFFTNAAGAKRDAQSFGDGRTQNVYWDGIWHVAAALQPDGWSVEIAIPFHTLRFKPQPETAVMIMGVNFKRRIRRLNEDGYWSLVPRHYTINRVSMAGQMILEGEISRARNLRFQPFFTTGVSRSFEEDSVGGDLDGGFDVKYSLTPSMTLDGTFNTDFSQVEVDAQQINLTRFSLFFPEKRVFFLENDELFQFGDIPLERSTTTRSEETQLFYSRRIGLSPAGQPLPLLGGARLSGRTGGFSLGLMNIHQREEGDLSSNNYTVLRLRRDILGNVSDIGAIFVNREGGEANDYNRSFGLDANLRFWRHGRVSTFVAGTRDPEVQGGSHQSKVSVDWNDGFWNGNILFADIGENFNPEVGFVPRRGVRNYQLKAGIKPRPEGRGFVRELNPHISMKYYTDRQDLTLTKDLHYGMKLLFGDGSQIEVSHNPAFERLLEPFELREGALIPPGDYPFNEFRLVYNSDRTQVLSGDLQYSNGGFYKGDKTSASMSGTLLFKPRLSAEVGYQYNRVDFVSSLVRADLYSLKVSYAFNPTLFLDSFIQYETDLDRVLTNVRFRWIHHPLSNLSVVFTQDRFAIESREIPDELSWALVFKYTHLFQF